jgi:hypothetical protein|tara:strand:- start:589 stop:921 length:333 start_codon:yes stop_codon:yes gene_type:complete
VENRVLISIADFSTYPSGRDERDGPFNGAKFRETVLKPAFQKAEQTGAKVVVSLSNVMSFGSSFLEEAFGGLVREGIFTKKVIKETLVLEPGSDVNLRYRDAILRYIDRA